MNEAERPHLHRRCVLGGAAALGVVPLLAACGSEESPEPTTADSPDRTEEPSTADGSSGSPDGAAGLVAAADVPVGGGVVLDEQKLVVTQPAEGEFKAFSAICTHQGCPVSSVEDGRISCPCHGSQFSIEDGSVVAGPADSPLEATEVTVQGGQVVES